MKDATAALAAKLLYLRFRQLDRERRWQGRLLEMAGYGAREQPGRMLTTAPGARLKAYRSAPADGPVILLVPAPIKRAYLWDLAPDVSVVARLLDGGVRPYLLEWDEPDPASGLGDYAARHLSAAAAAVRAETGAASIFLAGHSLGGLFAAIFSSLYPAQVRGLVLLGAPLHFGTDAASGALGPVAVTRLLDALPGNLPGACLRALSHTAAPAAFGSERQLDWARSLLDRQAMATHLRVERWCLDELPLAKRLLLDLAEQMFGADAYMRGSLQVTGRRAAAQAFAAPLFAVVDARCPLVPPASVLPFLDAAANPDKRLASYDGDIGVGIQHVGPLVGRSAHATLWPEIVRWLWQHWR
ncbi:MAG: alpha/beta fold hydrolase [Rhodocyclales bacterium]|nr:alpha/beta fold hydrolase [Rhodocyclales bacterium]